MNKKKIAFQIAAGLVSASFTAVAGAPAGMGAAGVISLVNPHLTKKQKTISAISCFGSGIAIWFLDRWAEKKTAELDAEIQAGYEELAKHQEYMDGIPARLRRAQGAPAEEATREFLDKQAERVDAVLKDLPGVTNNITKKE